MYLGKAKIDIEKLVLSLLAVLGVGAIGGAVTASRVPVWYEALNKPAFSPPNNIFSPVWIALYILMGISLFLVWSKGWDKAKVRSAVRLFLIHLIVNLAWSIFFFGFRSPLLGLVVILILLGMIIAVIVKFYRLSKPAAYLLIPYLLWVSFATFLNFSVWRLN